MDKIRNENINLFKGNSSRIQGNKVCSPDVWSLEDILTFCNLYKFYDIIWIVRNPIDNLISRYYRETSDHYYIEAQKYLPLNYDSSYDCWASSWAISIENYRRLARHNKNHVHLVYYDDLVNDQNEIIKDLFKSLNIVWHKNIDNWFNLPHTDSKGRLKKDLKYKDQPIQRTSREIDSHQLKAIEKSLEPYSYLVNLWSDRKLKP
jgi:hypothetical protein